MKLKIAIAQLNFLVGDIDGNAERIIAETKKIAEQDQADVVVFPELALTGYPPEDLLFRSGFYKRCHHAMEYIKENINDTAIIIGYPDKIHGKIYNKAAVIHKHKIMADYAKQELPNYTVFDEKRYFTSGNQPCVFKFKGIQIGLVICEDIWHTSPILASKNAGAQLIICINASPYHKTQIETREKTLKERVTETQLPIIYANLVGGQDELVFDGSSMVFDTQGNHAQQAAFCKEAIMIVEAEIKNNNVDISRHTLPSSLSREQQLYEILKLGVKDYIHKNHFPRTYVGVSGGVDSALTLAIAADAIGPENVVALIMPSQYSAKMSAEDGIALCDALGVPYHIIPIEPLLNAFLNALAPVFQNKEPDSTEENLQARIRGMLLMAMANKFGGIVLTTGNKSELSVGYATLYGDMAGGFSVIKDLTKTQVYKLSRYRNQITPVIPERILTRAPSAELKPNQLDQDSLPPYDILDEILERYIEKDESRADIIEAGFDKPIVDNIVKMINQNEYKRRQAPIGVRLTQKAFGKDRRYPITSGYTRS